MHRDQGDWKADRDWPKEQDRNDVDRKRDNRDDWRDGERKRVRDGGYQGRKDEGQWHDGPREKRPFSRDFSHQVPKKLFPGLHSLLETFWWRPMGVRWPSRPRSQNL